MAKGRISEDQLRYTIDVNSSKAQQEVHKLERKLSELNAESRSYVNTITKIKAKGEEYPGQLKKVRAEYRKTSIAISETKEKLVETARSIHVNDMTMNQLRKQAKSLRAELNNTVKSLEPEKYNILAKRLSEVNNRMQDLTISSRNLKETLLDKGVFDVFIGNLMTNIGDFIGSKLAQVKDFIDDGVEMARAADGITKAFRELNDPNLLENLRKATRGTVNDVELMNLNFNLICNDKTSVFVKYL